MQTLAKLFAADVYSRNGVADWRHTEELFGFLQSDKYKAHIEEAMSYPHNGVMKLIYRFPDKSLLVIHRLPPTGATTKWINTFQAIT